MPRSITHRYRPSLLTAATFLVEPHGLTAVVSFVSSAELTEACPPSPRLRRTPARIPPRLHSRGFLRRRAKRTPAPLRAVTLHMCVCPPHAGAHVEEARWPSIVLQTNPRTQGGRIVDRPKRRNTANAIDI